MTYFFGLSLSPAEIMHIAGGHCLIIQLIVIEDLLGVVLGIHKAGI